MKKRILSVLLLGSMAAGLISCENYIPGTIQENAASGQAVCQSDEYQNKNETIGYTTFSSGNSTNCYALYDYEEDREKEFRSSTDILQFDRSKNVSAEIDTGIEGLLFIEKVTEKAIYCCSHNSKKSKEYLYRIPLKKTEGNDIVLVDEKEKIMTSADAVLDYSYLDDNSVVYQVLEEEADGGGIEAVHWYRYDMDKKETVVLEGTPPDSELLYGSLKVSDTELVAYYTDTEQAIEYYYYNKGQNRVCRADLGDFFYNKYSFIHQCGENIYFTDEDCATSLYEGIITLKRYNMKTDQVEDVITQEEWKTFLKKEKLWEKGLTVSVEQIMEGEGRLYMVVSMEKFDKKKVRHRNYILVSRSITGESGLQCETKLNDKIRDKGDKEVFTDRYNIKHRQEDATPFLTYYPYINIEDREIYNIKSEESMEIKDEKESNWGYQLSSYGFDF